MQSSLGRQAQRLVLVLVLAAPLQAIAVDSFEATTSAAARNEAARAIPLRQIDKKHRAAVHQVVHDASLYRRLPTVTVNCQPRLFTFLAQNPEVLVEIWRHLGISQVDLQRIGQNTFRMLDGAGTDGHLYIVEQECNDDAQNRIVMYAEALYDGKAFRKPLKCQCVILLRSGSVKETDGRNYVAARMDTFVRLDRGAFELVAKAAHPFLGKVADRNFADTMQFVSNLSQAAEQRPDAIERLAGKLPRVPMSQQGEFVQIAYQCNAAQRQRNPLQVGGNPAANRSRQ